MSSLIRVGYKPLAIHRPFHQSQKPERLIAGAFGSGKTWGLMAEALATGLEYPGGEVCIARKTIPELRDTTEQTFLEVMPPSLLKRCITRRSGGHYESITMPNGTKYIFRSMDDPQKWRSLNLSALFVDEANEFSQEEYDLMISRVRRVTPHGAQNAGKKILKRPVCLATNPDGHDWIYRHFVNPITAGPDTAWFKSTSFDNPFLPASYVERLLQYPEQWIRRYVLCQFDEFAGQIYDQWDWERNMIDPIPREKLPQEAMFWMGFDPGMEADTGANWAYVDRLNRRLVIVRDYLGAGMGVAEHAAGFRKKEASYKMQGRVRARIADPNIMKRDPVTTNSLHSFYGKEGFHFTNGPIAEKVRVPTLANLIANRQFVVMRGEDSAQRTAEQIAGCRWKDISPQARAAGTQAPGRVLKKDIELVDCSQYLGSRWLAPAKLKKAPTKTSFDDEVWANVKKQLQRSGAQKPLPEGVVL